MLVEKVRLWDWRRNLARYGLTIQDFYRMLCYQGNRCAICPRLFVEPKRPHIDHDHVTGAECPFKFQQLTQQGALQTLIHGHGHASSLLRT